MPPCNCIGRRYLASEGKRLADRFLSLLYLDHSKHIAINFDIPGSAGCWQKSNKVVCNYLPTPKTVSSV